MPSAGSSASPTGAASSRGDGEPRVIVGLIGGIASGKSAVSDILRRWGAELFNADQMGHAALRQPAILRQLTARWGPPILDANGEAIRSAIAERVFQASEQGTADLAFLNSVSHPWIRAMFQRQRSRCRAPVLLVDAALLIEANWDRWCNVVLFIDAPDDLRKARALQRNWTEEQWHAREATQLPLNRKREQATHVIDNSGTLEQLQQQLAPLANDWGLQPQRF